MNTGTGVVSGVRVTHDRSSVAEIEAEQFDDQSAIVAELLDADPVAEAFALQTCHRIEAYVVTDDADTGRALLDGLGLAPAHARRMGHEESLRHLMRVAAGLDSVVLGEDQILGQVRDAYQDAREAGGVGDLLEAVVTKAIHVGERARTETAINEGVVSMGSAAAKLAVERHDLDDATALVVGAGEMGTLAAKALGATGVSRLVVANRTPERAAEVVRHVPVPGDATGLDALDAHLARADVVVAATGADEPVLDADLLGDAGGTVVVDLGQPRDLAAAAADLPGVTAYDIDDLAAVTDATHEQRREAAGAVEATIDREYDRLLDQQKRRRADEVIGRMYASAEHLKQRELATAFSRMETGGDLTDDQREVVESLADALVAKILSAPTKSLREAAAEDDWSTIDTALQLFDPEFDGDSPFDLPVGENRDGPPSAGEAAGPPAFVREMLAGDGSPDGPPADVDVESLLDDGEPPADYFDDPAVVGEAAAESEDD